MSDAPLQPFEKPAAKPDDPVCPYCGDDPMLIRAKEVVFPAGGIMLLVMCGNEKCRKTLTVSPFGVTEKQPGRIVRPS